MQYFLGIDLGTTNIKGIVFQDDGVEVCSASEPSPVQPLGEGGAVYDPKALWNIACRLLSILTEYLRLERGEEEWKNLAGAAVTGMGEAGVPLGTDGTPLYPVIAWYDSRTRIYADRWREEFGNDRLFQITALRNQHIFTANKLMWLQEHEEDTMKQMERWHCVPDYISFCLTGQSVMDVSLAARTMLFDLSKGDWSEELLKFVGVKRTVLPRVVPSGSFIGPVSGQAAAATGLPEGMPVFAGGHDHICGALAVGIFRQGCLLDSSGTSEELLVSSPQLERVWHLGGMGYNVGPHVVPGQFYLAGGMPASGASVDWFRRQFGQRHAGQPGANGLLFVPHLRGSSSPERRGTAAGAFLRIRDFHTGDDFAQAVYDGVCMEARLLAESLLDSERLERMVSIGGGTKNPVWMQTKANVMNKPVEVPEVREAAAFGAALLAAVGAGRYASCQEAFSKTYRIGEIVRPHSEAVEIYQERYQEFQNVRAVLRAVDEN